MEDVSSEEMIRRAAACRVCRKPHDFIRESVLSGSWASPEDGHGYSPYVQPETLALMHWLAGGERVLPGSYPGVPQKWWTQKIVRPVRGASEAKAPKAQLP